MQFTSAAKAASITLILMVHTHGEYVVPPSVSRDGRVRSRRPGPLGRFFGASGRFLFEVAKVVLVALVIIVPIRWFIFQPFEVKGNSMDPNFLNSDYLIVDEISYRFREPERGEVVIFRFPRDRSQFFIKRIIGLPSETIKIEDGKVYIANEESMHLDETGYLMATAGQIGTNQEVVLGSDEYYVLGDNRDASSDSRSWGPIKDSDIIGRAWFRAFPFDRAETIDTPTY
ncbi:MAG: signal peptidase I [Parcubacteria group bacterium]